MPLTSWTCIDSHIEGFNHEWMTTKCLQIVRSIQFSYRISSLLDNVPQTACMGNAVLSIITIPLIPTLMTGTLLWFLSKMVSNRQLCLHCGLLGHCTNNCTASKPSNPHVSSSLNGGQQTVSIKSNKALCVSYNVHGSCTMTPTLTMSEHVPPFALIPNTSATACTQNWSSLNPVQSVTPYVPEHGAGTSWNRPHPKLS